MFNKLYKICLASLILIGSPIFASAYFSDIESSTENFIGSGTLYFSLRSNQTTFFPYETAEDMNPGDKITRDIFIKKEGSLPFKYNALSQPVEGSCDMDLYDNLQLKVWYNYYGDSNSEGSENKILKYEGLLKDFKLNQADDLDLQIDNSFPYLSNPLYEESEHWIYSEIILPEDVSLDLQNKSCSFDFVFNAWQTNMEESDGGFSDKKSINNNVSTKDWKPDVDMVYPVGGEVWYLVPDNCASIHSCSLWCQNHGMNANCEYSIQWSATNKIGPDSDLLIDIYFSNDSGNNWINHIADKTSNTGGYLWRPPYLPEYITKKGRIKVVATDKEHSFLWDYDMSEDFCPPMLTLEDLINFDEEKYVMEKIEEVETEGAEETVEEEVEEEVNNDDEVVLSEEIVISAGSNDDVEEVVLTPAKEENEEENIIDIIEEESDDETLGDEEVVIEEDSIEETKEEPVIEEEQENLVEVEILEDVIDKFI